VDTLRDCWLAADLQKHAVSKAKGKGTTDFPAEPWRIKLLVVDCDDDTPTCATTTGVVATNVLWISNPQNASYVPMQMAGIPAANGGDQVVSWASNTADPAARWAEFAQHFNLRDEDGRLAPPPGGGDFNVYMHPNCDFMEPAGGTGGINYGVLARVPVLVQ
jgi:hypothetical protein